MRNEMGDRAYPIESHGEIINIFCCSNSQSTQIDINNDTHAIFHLGYCFIAQTTKKKNAKNLAILPRCRRSLRNGLQANINTISQMMIKKKIL